MRGLRTRCPGCDVLVAYKPPGKDHPEILDLQIRHEMHSHSVFYAILYIHDVASLMGYI